LVPFDAYPPFPPLTFFIFGGFWVYLRPPDIVAFVFFTLFSWASWYFFGFDPTLGPFFLPTMSHVLIPHMGVRATLAVVFPRWFTEHPRGKEPKAHKKKPNYALRRIQVAVVLNLRPDSIPVPSVAAISVTSPPFIGPVPPPLFFFSTPFFLFSFVPLACPLYVYPSLLSSICSYPFFSLAVLDFQLFFISSLPPGFSSENRRCLTDAPQPLFRPTAPSPPFFFFFFPLPRVCFF